MSLPALVRHHWALTPTPLAPLAEGHTNASFAFTAGGHGYVLRRSFAGKPRAQLDVEAALLDALAAPQRSRPVPRIVRTRAGAADAIDDEGRVLRLFARCPGAVGPRWLQPNDRAKARAALAELRALHAALTTLTPLTPQTTQTPLTPQTTLPTLPTQPPLTPLTPQTTLAPADALPCAFIVERWRRVCAGDRAPLPDGADELLARIGELVHAGALAPRPWLHGDYHLGNLLWHGDAVAAVVDFDDCGRGDPAIERALARFALARRDDHARFAYDDALFDVDLGDDEPLPLPRATLELLFCAQEVLVHAEAAQRGLWQLAPGIGFHPCWRRLVTA